MNEQRTGHHRSKQIALSLFVAFGLLLSSSNLHAQSQLAAVAVKPDQSVVYCGGANRVLYSLDPETLEVRDRTYLGFEADEMFVSNAGNVLLVASHDEGWITLLSTTDFSQISRIEKVFDYAVAAEADQVLVAYKSSYSGGKQTSQCQVLNFVTGEQVAEAVFADGIHTVGCLPDASQFVMMTKGVSDDSESKVERSQEKQTQLTRSTRRQQHDQRTCQIIWLDQKLNEVKRGKSWYTNQSTSRIAFNGSTFHAISPYNFNATFEQDGKIKAFEFSNWMVGMGLSSDQRKVAGGQGRTGIIKTLDNPKYASFEIPVHAKIDQEQIAGVAFAADGTILCTTNGFRIAKIDSERTAKVIKEFSKPELMLKPN